MARLDSFLRLIVEQSASDLHFHSGNVPMIRYNADLVRLPFRVLSETEVRRFLYEIMTPEQKKTFERERDLDFLYEIAGVARFRANVFVQNSGLGAVFRVIPYRLPTIDELELPGSVRRLTQLQNGLVLVTGPCGSGKTTTLGALVHEINRTAQRHVITIEDPIEFVHEPLKSVITQRQVGKHCKTFAGALRSALREAPDVVVVGELRDLETIQLALSAAETGVLVMGTMHTNTAAKAVNRIIDALPEENREQMRSVLAVLLRGVIAQRLCKRSSGEGRIAALEVMLHNWAVAHLIRDNKIHQLEGYLQSTNYDKTGMQSLDHAAFALVRDGVVSLEEGMRIAHQPEQLRARCSQLGEVA